METIALTALLKDAPGYFVLTVGFIFIVFAMYLKVRSVSIDEVTSIGKLQSEQVAELLRQVSQLSKDLSAARGEISTLYKKIDELEDLVRHYKTKIPPSSLDTKDLQSWLYP